MSNVLTVVLSYINKDGEWVMNPYLYNKVKDNPNVMIVVNDRYYLWDNRVPDVILDHNTSVARSRNSILNFAKNSSFEYLTMIDGDDDITENYFEVINSLSTDSFIVFDGYWNNGKLHILSNHPKLHMIKYVNWLYFWNINWMIKNNIHYPDVDDSWAEDELLFTYIALRTEVFKIRIGPIYIYNHKEGVVNTLDKDESDELTTYYNYSKEFKYEFIK